MATTEEMIAYIGKDRFVKFTNTADFPEMSNSTKDFLKNYGVYSDEKGYPFLTTDGVLRRLNSNLIEVGKGIVGNPFCIKLPENNLVGFDLKDKKYDIINASIQKYIETLYVYEKFTMEVHLKETLGEYWANHKKYAQKLKEMLQQVEPNIMDYETWYVQVMEMDLGII